MQKRKKGRVFGRVRKGRTALLRSLAISFIEKGKIATTEAKAKELRPFIERLVTFGKKGTLASERVIISRLSNASATRKIMKDIAPKYKDRAGGYTRITKTGIRRADASARALIEFV